MKQTSCLCNCTKLYQEVAGRFGGVLKKACDIKLWPTALEVLDEMRAAEGPLTPDLSHFTLVLECLHKVISLVCHVLIVVGKREVSS